MPTPKEPSFLQTYDEEVPRVGHFHLFFHAEPSYVSCSSAAALRPFRHSTPLTRCPIKVFRVNFSAWPGCRRELGKLQWVRSSPGTPMGARRPEDNRAQDSPGTKLGISTSSLSPAGFLSASCFLARLSEGRENVLLLLLQSGNSVLHFVRFPFTL